MGAVFVLAAKPRHRLRDGLSAGALLAPFCRIPGSHVLLSANKRTQKLLIPLVFSRQAKLSADNFDAAVRLEQNLPGWPASDFPVLSKRDNDGAFLSGVYLLEIGRPTPGMRVCLAEM